jgi:hypothetical protein
MKLALIAIDLPNETMSKHFKMFRTNYISLKIENLVDAK